MSVAVHSFRSAPSNRRAYSYHSLPRRQCLIEGNAFCSIASDVMVIDGGGSLRTALIGDMIVSSAIGNGWAGTIAYGAIRDSAQINALDFHVKSLGTNLRKSAKRGDGEFDVPIVFGNIRFVLGEYLYSDEDGIVVVSGPIAG